MEDEENTIAESGQNGHYGVVVGLQEATAHRYTMSIRRRSTVRADWDDKSEHDAVYKTALTINCVGSPARVSSYMDLALPAVKYRNSSNLTSIARRR